MEKLSIYLKESYDELINKVSWPTWDNLIDSAKIVLVFVLISTLCVFVMDLICHSLMDFVYGAS